jgi:dihydrofolate reductase
MFDIVVAHDLNRGIGKNNTLPWHCAPDMAYFKLLTTHCAPGTSNAVIMGRNTWESLPSRFKPLPNRTNIVVSKKLNSLDTASVAPTFEEALQMASPSAHIFVIGGQQLYATAINHPECRTLYITKIFNRFECDTTFPDYQSLFTCTYASNVWVTPMANCAFFTYTKNKG